MLESARNHAEAIPRLSLGALVSISTLGSFVWLLAQDRVPSTVVYLLQVYLTF